MSDLPHIKPPKYNEWTYHPYINRWRLKLPDFLGDECVLEIRQHVKNSWLVGCEPVFRDHQIDGIANIEDAKEEAILAVYSAIDNWSDWIAATRNALRWIKKSKYKVMSNKNATGEIPQSQSKGFEVTIQLPKPGEHFSFDTVLAENAVIKPPSIGDYLPVEVGNRWLPGLVENLDDNDLRLLLRLPGDAKEDLLITQLSKELASRHFLLTPGIQVEEYITETDGDHEIRVITKGRLIYTTLIENTKKQE